MKSNLFHFISNPLSIAFIISAVLISVFYPILPHYKFELINKEYSNNLQHHFYSDFDNDGSSESIALQNTYNNTTNFIVRKQNTIIDQWSFEGKYIYHNLIVGDYDSNNKKEIYIFTLFDNNIYLYVVDPISKKIIINKLFVDKFIPQKGETQPGLGYFKLIDVNNDGTKEFFFVIKTGYSLFPRRAYLFNFGNGTLLKSPPNFISMHSVNTVVFNESITNFISGSVAVYNSDSSDNYSDYYTWLTILDDSLKYRIDPIKLGVYPSSLFVKPIDINNKLQLFTYNYYYGVDLDLSSYRIFDLNGKLLKEKLIDSASKNFPILMFTRNKFLDKVFILYKDCTIRTLDSNFVSETIYENKNKFLSIDTSELVDIDEDGEEELIAIDYSAKKLIIVSDDLSSSVEVNGITIEGYCNFSKIKQKK